jgi:hypothetical protein
MATIGIRIDNDSLDKLNNYCKQNSYNRTELVLFSLEKYTGISLQKKTSKESLIRENGLLKNKIKELEKVINENNLPKLINRISILKKS